jgi:hypothetical protein
MKYYCPRSYTDDCNASKCLHWGKPECVDGQPKAETVTKNNQKRSLVQGPIALIATYRFVLFLEPLNVWMEM